MATKSSTPAPTYMRRENTFVKVITTGGKYTFAENVASGRVARIKTSHFLKGYTKTTPQAAKARAVQSQSA